MVTVTDKKEMAIRISCDKITAAKPLKIKVI